MKELLNTQSNINDNFLKQYFQEIYVDFYKNNT